MSTSQDDIEQLVQARWRAIGLSQSDLAEVLCADPASATTGSNGAATIDARRLEIVAEVLGIGTAIGNRQATATDRARAGTPAPQSLLSLLELRMLRVFREVQDPATKRILIELAEQIVKRQTTPPKAG